jgi:competence CoiA-like predicted nuclease
MPFVALDRHTQKRICILHFDKPKEQIDKDALVCQECGESLYIKAGEIKRPHFCHYANPDSMCKSRGESENHMDAKRYVMEFLQQEYSGATVELEVMNRKAGRIADVLLTEDSGKQTAHEIQLSSITLGDLKERTLSYADHGISCVWWLGSKARNAHNEKWCSDSQGGFYNLYFVAGEITHKHVFSIGVEDMPRYFKENNLQLVKLNWTRAGELIAKVARSARFEHGETP